jgi:signal transduction histidine kinase
MILNIAELQALAADKNLLILEDDEEVIAALSRLLSRFFKEVFSATSISEAFTYYHEKRLEAPLLIITDINLGLQSGVDFTCQVKKIDPFQRVISVSATEERSVFIDTIECGIDRFILKPIEQDRLFDALISVLKKIDYDRELHKNQKLLEESREYALRLVQEQDQFLKNAIHEIHTPLAVIITNIDLLRMEGIDHEYLSAIEAGSRIIQNSYEDMTYLMKHDRIADTKTNINIVEFIAERIRYFNCIAQVNELSLSLIVGQPNLPEIHLSELRLARLVDNTISNAIKYSKRPSDINITIGIHKGSFYFEVHNYGPLIADKKKIFERFFRESDTKGGYGLGLNIVAQICQEENIEIKITSSVSRGTSFRYIFNNATLLQHNSPKMSYID